MRPFLLAKFKTNFQWIFVRFLWMNILPKNGLIYFALFIFDKDIIVKDFCINSLLLFISAITFCHYWWLFSDFSFFQSMERVNRGENKYIALLKWSLEVIDNWQTYIHKSSTEVGIYHHTSKAAVNYAMARYNNYNNNNNSTFGISYQWKFKVRFEHFLWIQIKKPLSTIIHTLFSRNCNLIAK